MTIQATYETQVMPDGTWVEGNWSDYPGAPPKFNVYRKGGISLSDLGIGSNANFNQVPLDYGQEKAKELLGRYKDMLLTSSEPNWEFDDDPEEMSPALQLENEYAKQFGGPLISRTIRYSPPNAILKTPHLDSPYMDQLIKRGFKPLKAPTPIKSIQLPYFV